MSHVENGVSYRFLSKRISFQENYPKVENGLRFDKVCMHEEMMTNDDIVTNTTSSLLKIRSLYKFCYKLHMSSWRSRWTEL